MIHKHVVLGGTFDRLHDGHISYLRTAFENSNRVTVGLTTDKLHGDKELKQIIQPYDLRKRELLATIKENWPHVPVTILPIDDIYGTSITDSTIEAIAVTESTISNVNKINLERAKRGLGELRLIAVPLVAADDNKTLSSSRIRRGEIDRNGTVFSRFFSKKHSLPENLRPELRKPLGVVINGGENDKINIATKAKKLLENKKYTVSIAVGDVVSSTLEDVGLKIDIEVIDFKTQRRPLPSFEENERFDAINPAGIINVTTAKLLEKEIDKIIKNKALPAGSRVKKTITIDGEEDLLVLPAILFAPLESIVFYGQRDIGIIMVTVTEEIKKQALELVSKFL